jgi:hypothetical protein
MNNLTTRRSWRRLIALAAAYAALSQVSGCLLDPQQLAAQAVGFVRDFALQVLAAFLL